jgi:PadR family transcriptional regulator
MKGIRVTRDVAVVLRVFVDDVSASRHGYELMRLTGFPSGKMYPILARLQAAEWLDATVEDIDPAIEGRPRRRLYRLTERGGAAAQMELAALYNEIAPSPLPGAQLRPLGGLA